MLSVMAFPSSELPDNVDVHVHESDRIRLVFIRVRSPDTRQPILSELEVYLVDQLVANFTFHELPDDSALPRIVAAVQDILVAPGIHGKMGRPIEDFVGPVVPRATRTPLSDELLEVNGVIKSVKELRRIVGVNEGALSRSEFRDVLPSDPKRMLMKASMLIQNRLYRELIALRS